MATESSVTYEELFRATQAAYGRQERRNNAQRRALAELRDELSNFADYSRAVAADAAGQTRLAWQERAAWAQRLTATATEVLADEGRDA